MLRHSIAPQTPYLLLAAWTFFLLATFIVLAQTQPDLSDNIGYVYAAKQLAEGQGLTYEDDNNQFGNGYFTMYAFQIDRGNEGLQFLGFPPGFSILLATGILLTGQTPVVHYVTPLMAVLGMVIAFLLGRTFLEDNWGGWWTAFFVSAGVIYWEFGTAAWSEIPSLLFVTGGFVCYWLSRDSRQSLRRRRFLSLLGGFLLGFSLFIRYANISFLLAIVLYEVAAAWRHLWWEKERWLFFIVVGVAVAAIPLFNKLYYGDFTLTNYSPDHGWYPFPAFSLAYALGPSFVDGNSLVEAANTLWTNFPVLLLLVPLGWFFMKSPRGLLIALAFLSNLLLYSFYAFAPTGYNARFLIPLFPFLAVSATAVILKIGHWLPNGYLRWMLGAVLLLVFILPLPGEIAELQLRNRRNKNTVSSIEHIVEQTPADAVFLSYSRNDLLAYYGHRSVLNYRRIPPSDTQAGRFQYEYLEPCLVLTVTELLEADKPVYYYEEGTESVWNPITILRNHFSLSLVQENPNIHKISLASTPGAALSCPP